MSYNNFEQIHSNWGAWYKNGEKQMYIIHSEETPEELINLKLKVQSCIPMQDFVFTLDPFSYPYFASDLYGAFHALETMKQYAGTSKYYNFLTQFLKETIDYKKNETDYYTKKHYEQPYQNLESIRFFKVVFKGHGLTIYQMTDTIWNMETLENCPAELAAKCRGKLWEHIDAWTKEIRENEVVHDDAQPEAAYYIYCQTGCSCCSYDNHYRGPYRAKEDAERRVNFFLTSDGDDKYHPLASQYSKRGNYSIEERKLEFMPEYDNVIIGKTVMAINDLKFVDVGKDGRVYDKLSEGSHFSDDD
jgi:hypothetical protein